MSLGFSPTGTLYSLWVRVSLRFVALPAWVQVISIYAVSRLWGFLLFSTVGRQQIVSPWGSGPMGYLKFTSLWDSDWYRQIALGGYPSELPRDAMGRVTENTWAFYPLFPYSAAALGRLLGVSYFTAASLLSLVAGFVAAWVIFVLMRTSLEIVGKRVGAAPADSDERATASSRQRLALWAVAAVSFMPVAPVLQVPYAESLNLVFLALTLFLLMRRRWWLATGAAVLACLSRPVGVPLGATAGLWWFWCCARVFHGARKEAKSPVRALAIALKETGSQLVSALMICAEALLWPVIAWYRTGRLDAYTATETAWRGSDLALFAPWIRQSQVYFGAWGIPLLIVLATGFVLFLRSRAVRENLHPILIFWCAIYCIYLLLFLNPQSSLFRLLLPLFPLCLGCVALSRSGAYRMLLLIFGAAMQFGWVGWLWHWKQLPSGGDYPP